MSKVQAVLFNKNYWTKSKARSWLHSHDYAPIKPVHTTNNYLRYRICEPTLHNYRTQSFGKNIKAVIGSGNMKPINKHILNIRPDHYARLMQRPNRGGSLYSLMANNHGLINGIVGGIHALMSLAALGGIGYAISKKVNKSAN